MVGDRLLCFCVRWWIGVWVGIGWLAGCWMLAVGEWVDVKECGVWVGMGGGGGV